MAKHKKIKSKPDVVKVEGVGESDWDYCHIEFRVNIHDEVEIAFESADFVASESRITVGYLDNPVNAARQLRKVADRLEEHAKAISED